MEKKNAKNVINAHIAAVVRIRRPRENLIIQPRNRAPVGAVEERSHLIELCLHLSEVFRRHYHY